MGQVQDKKEGTLRLLTLNEIALAHRVFGGSITYARVWIHCDSYLPFGLQDSRTAMAPNGELWFRKELYEHDFGKSTHSIATRHLFIHEMAHVWQHQHGQWVRLRGAFSWAADYTYDLDEKKTLTDYSLEQQAQIIADYFVLTTYGYSEWEYQKINLRSVSYTGKVRGNTLLSLYKNTLSDFLPKR
ncbi:type IV secretion protein Rhs [Brenneria corticis]|uniref:Type IV secretion protein Rhs n=1 Tax=Brenneria corticis TaxID=2173106 RepID=A0A2U1U488_9GAMM|nr:type IV secretion protein Rhs [Brenneria sp. CFCC 11842]PWC16457.1 type IV secretion protein Rhs [Brenneria sp. CFCC 11842]